MNIGIIGQGFVGSAVYEGMKNYCENKLEEQFLKINQIKNKMFVYL